MPVFNVEGYVETAVQSLLSQTFGDFELIIVEDRSTDSTATIVQKLAQGDQRIRLLDGAGDGVTAALIEAAKAARGAFLARMDGDDESHPERFERQIEFLEQEPHVAVVGSALKMVNADGRVFAERLYPCHPSEVRSLMPRANCVAHPTVLMRRSAFDAVGGYRPIFTVAQDYDLWLRILGRWEVANLEQPLLRYRVHDRQLGIAHIEAQTCATMRAQLAAVLRQTIGVDDELLESEDCKSALIRFGLSQRDIALQLALNAAGQAVLLRQAGAARSAVLLLDAIIKKRRELMIPLGEFARLSWVRGGCNVDCGRYFAAACSACLAGVLRPRLLFGWARKMAGLDKSETASPPDITWTDPDE